MEICLLPATLESAVCPSAIVGEEVEGVGTLESAPCPSAIVGEEVDARASGTCCGTCECVMPEACLFGRA